MLRRRALLLCRQQLGRQGRDTTLIMADDSLQQRPRFRQYGSDLFRRDGQRHVRDVADFRQRANTHSPPSLRPGVNGYAVWEPRIVDG